MKSNRYVAVIDIGKTNAKVALVDTENLTEVAVQKTPNLVLRDGLYPHYDIEALWQFIVVGLAKHQQRYGVDAISVTTHGAAAALIGADGHLALPVLDYEYDEYAEVAKIYQSMRASFLDTGSPRLPAGLNLGRQIYWQQKSFPREFKNVSTILMYPQYWTYRLTGVCANELTSLGCHTDLWSPQNADYTSLVDANDWRKLMAPVRSAVQTLGHITADLAGATGLKLGTLVACGIHDSNASLVPHLLARQKPFSVVSTGTWVISMAIGGAAPVLDEHRDTLINISAFGEAVPSARFMGGREFQIIQGEERPSITDENVSSVLNKGIFLVPSVVGGSGPFPDRKMQWIGDPSAAERFVGGSFYLALMTATCLDLISAQGDIIVEGPLAGNQQYLDMLSVATKRSVIVNQSATTGTTIGASLLLMPEKVLKATGSNHEGPKSTLWPQYAKRWQEFAA